MLHLEIKGDASTSIGTTSTFQSVVSNTVAGLSSKPLLMTCRVLVDAPDGSSMEARAILDSLHLPSRQNLVASSLERSMFMPQVTPLPLIMFPLSLEMICCESSGRLKNVQRINAISLQKSNLLCNTSKTTTDEQKMVVSFFLCPRNYMLSHWANPDLRL